MIRPLDASTRWRAENAQRSWDAPHKPIGEGRDVATHALWRACCAAAQAVRDHDEARHGTTMPDRRGLVAVSRALHAAYRARKAQTS